MRKKILIVDDNTELLALLGEGVGAAGFGVSLARNGIEALEKVRTARPDLVVLDLVLPELDGFGVCQAIRRDREMGKVPVIMLTGLTSEFTRYAGLESGANEYVKKPVSPEALVSQIRRLLAPRPNLSNSCIMRKTNGKGNHKPAPSHGLFTKIKRRARKNFFP